MAVKNRTEAIAEVDIKIVPTVTNATHRSLLNDDILNSVVFRKDIIASETPGAGVVTIDYIDKDTATVITAVNLAVSFTNIENGDVKYLQITKAAANTISFAGATDVSIRKNYINTVPTVVQYVVRNKNGIITVESINIDNDVLETKIIEIGDWNMDLSGTAPGGVAHGLDYTKIRSISVIIRADDNTLYSPLEYADTSGIASGHFLAASVNIVLSRITGGIFDSVAYDAVGYNRGWITIQYLP